MDVRARPLTRLVRGQVIAPGDPAYDVARRTFNGMIDRRPGVIVRPADVEDVVAAVRWAAERELGVAVRGGGHSVAGHSMPDGNVVVDLSRWRGVSVDPAARTADALGGSLLMDLDAATAAYGLAAPSGTFVDTGITGLTLGGGISYLIGSEGFACDSLLGAQLVTAGGEVLEVDAERDADLHWALRGGGGNFGVVTRLRYRLTSVEAVYGGYLRYRGAGVREVLEQVFALREHAPDALVIQAISRWSHVDGAPALTLIVAWRGPAEEGAAATAGLRAHPALVQDHVGPLTWLQLQALNAPIPFGLRHYWKGHFVRETSPALAAAVLDASAGAPDRSVVLVELIHGEAHRTPPDAAAFGSRMAAANVTALGIWTDPGADAAMTAWARRAAARIEPFSLTGAGYLNYPEADQSGTRVAAAFGEPSFTRLREIKRRVDPGNLFRFNANIPPA